MEFRGQFELDGVPPEEAWVVLSDPVAVRDALDGCEYITRIDDKEFNFDEYEPDEDVATLFEADPEVVAERSFVEGGQYAASMQVGVGSIKPHFELRGTITEREFPRMVATGGGDASSSRFEVESGMEIFETDDGSRIEWWATADISGRIAQLGGRALRPVTNKVVNSFFNNIREQIVDVEESEEGDGITGRLRNLV